MKIKGTLKDKKVGSNNILNKEKIIPPQEIPNPVDKNDSKNKAILITKYGAIANFALSISKGFTGYSIGSTALIADSINSMSDILCDLVVYWTVTEARKGVTPDRPWGQGKLEPIDSNISMSEIFQNETTDNMMRIPISYELYFGPNIKEAAALVVSVISIIVKEILFRYTLIAGNKANSAAVIANAWQHRADAVISSAVLVGLSASLAGFPWMDPIMGVVVSGFIVKQAFVMGRESLRDLSDTPASAAETLKLRETCLKVPGIITVEKLLARRSGPYLFVECTVGVVGTISASAAHRLASLTRKALLKKHSGRVANAVVHVSPLGSSGMGDAIPIDSARDHDHIAKEVTSAVLALPDIISVSEIQVYYKDDGRVVIKVDVNMRPELTIRAAHALAVQARQEIEKVLPNVAAVDVDLELEEYLPPPVTASSQTTTTSTNQLTESNSSTVMTNQSTVPSNQSTSTANQSTVSMHQNTVQPNQSSVSTNRSTVSTNQSNIPMNIIANQSTESTPQSKLQTSQSTPLTNQSTISITQSNNIIDDKNILIEKDIK